MLPETKILAASGCTEALAVAPRLLLAMGLAGWNEGGYESNYPPNTNKKGFPWVFVNPDTTTAGDRLLSKNT